MREQLKKIAQETLQIQQQGFYTAPSGKRVDIGAIQKASEDNSFLLTPDDGKKLVKDLTPHSNSENTSYKIINASTVKVILSEVQSGVPVAVLNFASAKNPGGGFLNGSLAQEEALAYSSGLYRTLVRHSAYYEKNKACKSMMYTDHAIYSPLVPFFRADDFKLLEVPVTTSIITLPAVNMGQVRQKREDVNKAKDVMKNRMRLPLAVFAHEKNTSIILGAYGCGVFQNDPNDIAGWWRELLIDENYSSCFKRVIFAVLDNPDGENIRAFERVFGDLFSETDG